jgi:hypothetical protein
MTRFHLCSGTLAVDYQPRTLAAMFAARETVAAKLDVSLLAEPFVISERASQLVI